MLVNIAIVIFLVVMSGTFAGLTLALFSLKISFLETKIRAGDRQAAKVFELRKKGNLLLCTLLLGNVTSYTIMAIYLGVITSSVTAGFIATSLIFIFGEILPQAVFPRYALVISEKLYWLVWIFLILFYPVSKPISWVLDKLLGEEGPILWTKKELGEFIKYYKDVGDGIIDKDEERIILGALSFSDKRVSAIMIPSSRVFFLHPETEIDDDIIHKIKSSGFSRMPVITQDLKKVIGILYTKDLIGIEPGYRVEELMKSENLISVKENTRLDDLLNTLVHRKMYMAMVTDQNGHFIGVATMEDIMEEILKTELEEKKK